MASTEHTLADRLEDLLPQTQCRRCTYAGCRPYAEAMAAGEAEINQCPPGGGPTILELAALLGRDPRPLNPAHGTEGPRRVAVIDEAACIGCARCLKACPVDAILGAAKQMHTVIAAECTGCELCLPPCPVDCITLAPAGPAPDDEPRERRRERAAWARRRYEARNARLAREQAEKAARLARKRPGVPGGAGGTR